MAHTEKKTGKIRLYSLNGVLLLNPFPQCPICKADVTQPPTPPTEQPHPTPTPSLQPTSTESATERTPLLSDNSNTSMIL